MDIEKNIRQRAGFLRSGLEDLDDRLQNERGKIDRMIAMLETPCPDYMRLSLPGVQDLAALANEAHGTASALEALIFQLIDDRKLT